MIRLHRSVCCVLVLWLDSPSSTKRNGEKGPHRKQMHQCAGQLGIHGFHKLRNISEDLWGVQRHQKDLQIRFCSATFFLNCVYEDESSIVLILSAFAKWGYLVLRFSTLHRFFDHSFHASAIIAWFSGTRKGIDATRDSVRTQSNRWTVWAIAWDG